MKRQFKNKLLRTFNKALLGLLLVCLGAMHTVSAAERTTLVTDAAGTQELWTFKTLLSHERLISRINQTDSKGKTYTYSNLGKIATRTDEQGRVTEYKYNNKNQKTMMVEAKGTPLERTTRYQYLTRELDLVTKITSPSVYSNNIKTIENAYDASNNLISTTVSGFNAQGGAVTRTTAFAYDADGKVTSIDGPRTDVNDITTLEYYDCNTGAECGQLKKVTNVAGHITTYDGYDVVARLLQSTDSNGVVTSYSYHPRGWVLSMTQTPPTGAARVTSYEYDNVGQMTKVTFPDGSQQNYVYDAAHDLREISDNLGNKVSYTYDAKGNRTDELVFDPDGTLVRSMITTYDMRNSIESINHGGSVTQLINDAVGNLSTETDPNQNPGTNHSFDALDRLSSTVDALTNNSGYQYNVADQLEQVTAPNGAVTQYEYDDLGNRTKEISADRGTISYSHDEAGNVVSMTDARGIIRSYAYDSLNRVTAVSYPDSSENITYVYDAANCGASVGRLCQTNDESGQSNFEYDVWGNLIQQTKVEVGKTYVTAYQYDAQNRVSQITYPNGRVVDYQRDSIGRITGVTTTVGGVTSDVISNRHYRADGVVIGQTLGNGLQETRSYDLQGRVTNITLAGVESRDYSYDANGNVLSIDKPVENRVYQYDVLDRLTADQQGTNGANVGNYLFEYDPNSNRTKLNSHFFEYQSNSNRLTKDGTQLITLDASGNTLNYTDDRSFAYNQAGRMRSVSHSGNLSAMYFYNALSQRTRKEIPASDSQVFHYDVYGNLLMQSTDQSDPVEDYIWVDGEPVRHTKINGQVSDGSIQTEIAKTYLTTDHLMTPRIGTNGAHAITWRWDGDAFGAHRPDTDPDSDGAATDILVGFPGQYWDNESALSYNWNRYYDAQLGRYVTSDSIGLGGGLNTFGYVLSNPLMYSDSNGLQVVLPLPLPPIGAPGGQQQPVGSLPSAGDVRDIIRAGICVLQPNLCGAMFNPSPYDGDIPSDDTPDGKKDRCIDICYPKLEESWLTSDIRTNNFNRCVNDCMDDPDMCK